MALTKDKKTGRFVKTTFNLSKKCSYCDKKFFCKYGLSSIQFEKKKFCSRQCSSKNQIGNTKKPHSEEWKKQNSLRHKGRRCSAETRRKMGDWQRGEKSKWWKGGVSTQYQLERASIECRLWRESVFTRDNYTCVWCSKKGGWSKEEKRQVVLNADHIKPFKWFPELRFAIDNGRTLCVDCHRTTDTYGARSVTTDLATPNY